MALSGVRVSLDVAMSGDADEQDCLISALASGGAPGADAERARLPADVCVVVDVSGSMGEESTVQDAAGATQRFGLSLLDVTKHAVRTVIETLGARDRLTLVAFDAVARCVLDSARMDAAGKAKARAELEKLRPGSTTNLWGGLELGLDKLRHAARKDADAAAAAAAPAARAFACGDRGDPGGAGPAADAAALRAPRTRAVLLLTDGVPNVAPAGGGTARDALVRYAESAAAGAAGGLDGHAARDRARLERELAALEAELDALEARERIAAKEAPRRRNSPQATLELERALAISAKTAERDAKQRELLEAAAPASAAALAAPAAAARGGALPASVWTFGFGYRLDSRLLRELAETGEGGYCFIPDSGFVGTAFVNALASLLAAGALRARLVLAPRHGATIAALPGWRDEPSDADAAAAAAGEAPSAAALAARAPIVVPLGALQHGQSRDVLARVRLPAGSAARSGAPCLDVTLEYEPATADATSPRRASDGPRATALTVSAGAGARARGGGGGGGGGLALQTLPGHVALARARLALVEASRRAMAAMDAGDDARARDVARELGESVRAIAAAAGVTIPAAEAEAAAAAGAATAAAGAAETAAARAPRPASAGREGVLSKLARTLSPREPPATARPATAGAAAPRARPPTLADDAAARARLAAFVLGTHPRAGARSAVYRMRGHRAALAHVGSFVMTRASAVCAAQLEAIARDCDGQFAAAVSRRDWYDRWGKHFLPSLARAHLLQQCNNFKDPGVQAYGGELFAALRAAANATFDKLPPPKPSLRAGDRPALGSGGMARSFNNACNGCFAPEARLALADGATRPCSEVAAGDLVRVAAAAGGGVARVVCVVRTHCERARCDLVALPGCGAAAPLRVTPWHPVRPAADAAWRFPAELDGARALDGAPCDSVYNFVLDRGHAIELSGAIAGGGDGGARATFAAAVTLGHGLESDAVVRHAYFGSRRIVDDLAALPGWRGGRVELLHGWLRRDDATGLLCGIHAERALPFDDAPLPPLPPPRAPALVSARA